MCAIMVNSNGAFSAPFFCFEVRHMAITKKLPPIGARITKSSAAVALCMVIYYFRTLFPIWNGIPFYSALAALWCLQPYSNSTKNNAGQRSIGTFTGAAYGPAFVAMAGRAANADLTLAWPTAVIAPLAPETFAAIMYADKLKGAEDPVAKRGEIVNEYKDTLASPAEAAANGYIDDVIAPSETRASIVMALDMLASKKVTRMAKKHSNIQL